MTIFISVMAALTAIAVLATKVVELYSAIHKHKRETPTPPASTATSTPSQTTARRVSFREVVDLVLIAYWLGFLVFMSLKSTETATKQDISLLGRYTAKPLTVMTVFFCAARLSAFSVSIAA